MAIFGYDDAGLSSQDTGLANNSICCYAVLSEAALVSKLSVWVREGDVAACAIVGFIAAASGDEVGSVTGGTTQEASIARNQAAGYVDLTYASPVSLSAGNYWLGYMGSSTATSLRNYYGSSGSRYIHYRGGTYPTIPGTIDFHFAANSVLRIYATYTVPSTGESYYYRMNQ